MKIYTDSMIAKRYNLPLDTVFMWMKKHYLKATLRKGKYTVKESDLVRFESIPPLLYEVVSDSHFLSDVGDYTSYGIKVTDLVLDKEVSIIPDVSTNKERVEEFCRIATEGILSLSHLYEVIEDFFY